MGKCTFGKLPLGKLNIWEVATWEIVTWEVALGKRPLGKYLTPPRQEIVLLLSTVLAIKNYKTGVFFMELLKKFSQEKYEEGRKQEYLVRKQERDEDPRKYYTVKMRLWI